MRRSGSSVTSILIAIPIIGLLAWYGIFAPENKIYQVEMGMTREEAIAAVEESPRWKEQDLSWLCGSGTRWSMCEEANRSRAVSWLIWGLGLDSFAVVGLDAAGQVVFAEKGIQ